MNYLETLNFGSNKLKSKNISSHILDSELLLSFTLNLPRENILTNLNKNCKTVFLSTGASNLKEIKRSVKILSNVNVKILHCVSEYPPSYDKINLSLIPYFKNHFNCKVGYSGHESDIFTSLAAVSIGASSIERHITLDKKLEGPDHTASLISSELKLLIDGIKELQLS